jgi:hypothetical protein
MAQQRNCSGIHGERIFVAIDDFGGPALLE